MATLPAHVYHAQIGASSAAFAVIASTADPDLPVPSCPDWSLRQLTTHMGRVHRWAAEIVGTRSASYIDFGSVPDGRLPDGGAARGRWLTEGAARLVTVLRDAGEDQVWAFGSKAPASFWARRQAHETMVHCADAQLAAGDPVHLPPELAADAIDEWLTVMSGPRFGRPDPRAAALPPGAALHVHATDAGGSGPSGSGPSGSGVSPDYGVPDDGVPEDGVPGGTVSPRASTGRLGGNGQWLVRHGEDGVSVLPGRDGGDVTLAGPAGEVLLVLLRRRPVAEGAVRVLGDPAVLDQWLDQTSF